MSTKETNGIESYEDACKKEGIEPIDEQKMIESGFTPDEIAYRKLKTITKAYNEGWVADYNDPNQEKWIPWFYFSPSGVRFCISLCNYSDADAGHAARLCFQNKATSDSAGKQHVELYAKFIN